MNNGGRVTLIAGILVAAILIWGLFTIIRNRDRSDGANENNPSASNQNVAAPASIKSFTVQKPNFVIGGDSLSKIEIWNGSGAQPVLLGTAVKKSGQGAGEVWTFAIPAAASKAIKIYALGFDLNGTPVANMPLSSDDLKKL